MTTHQSTSVCAVYRFGLLRTQVELNDDLSGDGVALLRRLEERGKKRRRVLYRPGELMIASPETLSTNLLVGDGHLDFLLRQSHRVGAELPEKRDVQQRQRNLEGVSERQLHQNGFCRDNKRALVQRESTLRRPETSYLP